MRADKSKMASIVDIVLIKIQVFYFDTGDKLILKQALNAGSSCFKSIVHKNIILYER